MRKVRYDKNQIRMSDMKKVKKEKFKQEKGHI